MVIKTYKTQDFRSKVVLRRARANVDLAIACLRAAVASKLSKSASVEAKMLFCHYLCTYSRYVHLCVWVFRVPVNRVSQEVIPLLVKCLTYLRLIAKSEELTNKQSKKLGDYANHVEARVDDLKVRCLKGVPSSGIVIGSRRPRMSQKMSKRESLTHVV